MRGGGSGSLVFVAEAWLNTSLVSVWPPSPGRLRQIRSTFKLCLEVIIILIHEETRYDLILEKK